ncbi:hypothetical protein C0995_009697 [Termitomyces sp. Mi166|nr:hypothetical protein C0995_009697 [Termitomyces sp. Mi166\
MEIRNHRKQRHKALTPAQRPRSGKSLPHGLAHMTWLEYWNISWWVAMAFTTGSVVWVINGFFSFLALVYSDVVISEAGLGWTAFIGATIFEAGSILGVFEAWNRDDVANFGWNLYILHHKNTADGSSATGHPGKLSKQWIWFTTNTKYFHELEKAWYKPNLLSLGWHIGFWNFIGAIGFTLCGALGYGAQVSSGVNYPSSLSMFWGGWAFLIASVMQWYEAVNSVVE